jgi:hypothetical protein
MSNNKNIKTNNFFLKDLKKTKLKPGLSLKLVYWVMRLELPCKRQTQKNHKAKF